MRSWRNAGKSAGDGSNHGARQLDRMPSALDMLPIIRAAVGPTLPLLMDSGVRRGSESVCALCLGADLVLAGRAPLYGAIAGRLEDPPPSQFFSARSIWSWANSVRQASTCWARTIYSTAFARHIICGAKSRATAVRGGRSGHGWRPSRDRSRHQARLCDARQDRRADSSAMTAAGMSARKSRRRRGSRRRAPCAGR